ncbi:MAG: D-glycero-beta-D-manno-heptose 1,7-bisphosphate 7-phosphatase [Lachnospiraceae bacterium]|nr:D-glycero-beta-D-manno-heptose 1,7-bisphosphate 7-phosphatase [Lachnospiraceae bacterium]MDE7273389.1 D-glycero-beta-D-manno-heptose 1,7-bisphosphate 7-phosphatase [Lachnospiraceae bacterium]
MERAVFLDRDGTINVDVDYLYETDKLVFIDGTFEALALLKEQGYRLIVISNQSGIARGYYGAPEVEQLHEYMNAILLRHSAAIDAFYYCPHVEQDRCTCRKPQTGLIERAAAEWDIDLACSYMVGDKETDVMTAVNAGCGYGLLLSGHAISDGLREKYKDNLYKNLWDFAQHICGKEAE